MTPNTKKPSLTKMEKERLGKKVRAEEEYLISQLGQESDLKAAPLVSEYFREQERKDFEERDLDLEMLNNLKGNRLHYFRYLAQILLKFASEEDIPKKYKIDVSLSDKGIAVKILGTKFIGAFAPSGLPQYDRHACKITAVKLGNTIAKLEGYVKSTEGGVILPDEVDLKTYGPRPTN